MEDQTYFHPSLQQSDMSIIHAGFRSSTSAERYVIGEINSDTIGDSL